MKENESALYSQYIIDGTRCELTPAELLDECMEYPDDATSDVSGEAFFDDIIDESTDPPLSSFQYDKSRFEDYLSDTCAASAAEREFTMLYPDHFTRLQIAGALISRLWSEGHFRLGDLRIWAQWDWNTRPIGNMAAFFGSVSAASDYIYGLGVRMADYLFLESDGRSSARFFAWLPEAQSPENVEGEEIHQLAEENILFKSSPYESRHPWISEKRKCPGTMNDDPSSWLLYIPFDTCSFRLGGSLLSQVNGHNGGKSPQISDPDYFIDCYEVVRELVEDGIVTAGTSVSDGGLATAAEKFRGNSGIELDICGLLASYQEADTARILFGEIPGALIQISDENYDYVDSQFILQDIAYYPVGRPDTSRKGVHVTDRCRNGVAGILASLLGQASEGED